MSKLFLAYRVLLGLVFNLFFLGLALFAIGWRRRASSTARCTGRSRTRSGAAHRIGPTRAASLPTSPTRSCGSSWAWPH